MSQRLPNLSAVFMRARRTRWSTCIAVGLILLGVVIYLAVVGSYYHDISPEGAGIRELADAVGIKTVRKCKENGSIYYLAVGPIPPGYVLASGPPVYVFDKHGALVEWIEDSGDQPDAMARWDMQSCQPITAERALKEIREGFRKQGSPGQMPENR
jgi:hypothetical protein